MICESCGKVLPASTRGRRFCDNRCRMAAKRAAVPAAKPVDGPVTAAVAKMLADVSLAGVDEARAALAGALARLVDGGSVPAAGQLRGVLDDLALLDSPDDLEFLEVVRVPGLGPKPGPGANGRRWS